MGFSKKRFSSRLFFSVLSASAVLSLFACAQNGQADPEASSQFASTTRSAVVLTQAADFSSGAHSIVTYSAPREALNDLLPTISDLGISSYGAYFYRLERFGSNNVTKFSVDDPSTPVWQFSTEGTEANSNPYNIVFASDTKAYLIRYGSPKVWIINPSAQTEAEFKTGELDLSSYDEGDGSPEPASGIIADGKLFLVMQRLSFWSPNDPAYLAVFDVSTDAEVDTGMGEVGKKGIKLDVKNPTAEIRYHGGYIYVAGNEGSLFAPVLPLEGGIQKISTTDYSKSSVMASSSQIPAFDLVSASKGYFVQYNAWGDNSLRSFDPQTGTVSSSNIAGIGDTGDRTINDLVIDADGLLWIADASLSDPGVYILDPSTDTVTQGPISTNLNPLQITFCER